jgi:membrane-associated protease RseP (regulator of RpoE activity)
MDDGTSPDEDLAEERESDPGEPRPLRWGLNLVLFGLTVLSVFFAGALYAQHAPERFAPIEIARVLPYGWRFAVPLLAILLTHEFGHYFAARYHKVDASLPYFIPMPPQLSPFGTMGAVISMRGRIRSRDALLDIGAAGPLAGLVVALPVLCIGIAHSPVETLKGPYLQEGQSLLYIALKRIFLGPIPDGSDITMSPVAFAGWVGMLVTMLNLLPVGQLDGGHIAYALFGRRQNRYARLIHASLVGAFLYNLARFAGPLVIHGAHGGYGLALGNSTFWLVWFALLWGMRRMSGQNHPPTDPSTLSPARRVVALACLVIFVLLFMPTPMAELGG